MIRLVVKIRYPWLLCPRFVYPLKAMPRIAVLRRGLNLRRPARYFDADEPGFESRLKNFNPAALAGSMAQLRRLGRTVRLTHAVIVFSDAGGPILTNSDRDWLWTTFRVPVFEQLLTRAGALAAYECEAHDGLHWVGEAAGRSPAVCGCGAGIAALRGRAAKLAS
jgi:hypothetical protein